VKQYSGFYLSSCNIFRPIFWVHRYRVAKNSFSRR
jgi:hypothetical protein